jgi:hypothetical protein
MMVSIITFGKPCSGAKTLGWEHSNGSLKMISKTLGWSDIPLMDFKNEFENKVGMYIPELEAGVFSEITLVITKCSLRIINPCNHDYPGMGRGLVCSLFI